jgi:DNA-binding response OmpR family regulator
MSAHFGSTGLVAPLNILIAEDEHLIAMLVEDALIAHGHNVIGIADTEAGALALADRQLPDLALCDVRLAGGDSGVDLAHALSARGILCLFLSGNCPTGTADRLIVGCLAKPFHIGALEAAIGAAIEHSAGSEPTVIPRGMTLFNAPPGGWA